MTCFREYNTRPWKKHPNGKYIDWLLRSLVQDYYVWYQACTQKQGKNLRSLPREQLKDEEPVYSVRNKHLYADIELLNLLKRIVVDECENDIIKYYVKSKDDKSTKGAWSLRILVTRPYIYRILNCLVYYDCNKYLTMPIDELLVWSALSYNKTAIYLLPMISVRSMLNLPPLNQSNLYGHHQLISDC